MWGGLLERVPRTFSLGSVKVTRGHCCEIHLFRALTQFSGKLPRRQHTPSFNQCHTCQRLQVAQVTSAIQSEMMTGKDDEEMAGQRGSCLSKDGVELLCVVM